MTEAERMRAMGRGELLQILLDKGDLSVMFPGIEVRQNPIWGGIGTPRQVGTQFVCTFSDGSSECMNVKLT